jgi:dTDP-4-amino-4,6-dideoxygalactose transaminase
LHEIVNYNGLFLIEDACQAHGAIYKNKKVGTFGDLGVFSFYPGKNLGAYGDGGAVCTDNEDLYRKLLKLRNYGQTKKYYHEEFGLNSRLDEIQAAILRVKLPYLDKWNKQRNMVASSYKEKLKGVKAQSIISESISCYHLFVIESNKRDEMMKYLKEKNIHTLIHYPVPIHLQKCYASLGYKAGDLVNAENAAQKVLSLPIYPELGDDEIGYIGTEVNRFIQDYE